MNAWSERGSDPSVCHVVHDLSPSSGGTSQAIVQLCDALVGCCRGTVMLLSGYENYDRGLPSNHPALCRIDVASATAFDRVAAISLKKALMHHVSNGYSGVIHSHGMWMAANHWASVVAGNVGCAHVIQPHGMLQPWALGHKRVKKRIAGALYQWRDLRGASLFVATSEAEYQCIRALGLRQPVAIIPHGIRKYETRLGVSSPERPDRIRQLLFLSRIHPVKGLDDLVQAWADVRPRGWRLVVAGPSEEGCWDSVARRIKELNIEQDVVYLGELDDTAKIEAFLQADVFVLPSYSENFGLVVAEALSFSLPVVATTGAPWQVLRDEDCGWWVEPGRRSLAAALREVFSLSDADRAAMGTRARELSVRFDWSAIAGATWDVYAWLLFGGLKPSCVRTD